MNRHQAESLALSFKVALIPHTDRVEIAGSIRRRKPEVKDIEIVCLAKLGEPSKDMFGAPVSNWPVNLTLEALPQVLNATGWQIGSKNGERYKQLVHSERLIKLDLFITPDPAEWGLLYLIRTGSAKFNQAFMSYVIRRGMHVTGNRLHGHGKLWVAGKWKACEKGSSCPLIVATLEEEAAFKAVGLDYIAPEERKQHEITNS